MTEAQYKKRIRVEVATSVKGVHTYSATVEMVDTEQDIVLLESDTLIAKLDQRYPPQIENKKGE